MNLKTEVRGARHDKVVIRIVICVVVAVDSIVIVGVDRANKGAHIAQTHPDLPPSIELAFIRVQPIEFYSGKNPLASS